jgi:hypothetical protein
VRGVHFDVDEKMAAALCALLLLGSVNSFNVNSRIAGSRALPSMRHSGFVTDSSGVIVGLAENIAEAAPILADEVELTKLFGRLAEKRVLLDVPGAGVLPSQTSGVELRKP